jgi:hypothetical protein
MAISVTITQSNGAYVISPTAPGSANPSSFEITNNSGGGVTLYFQMVGTTSSPLPASQDIANGGNWTTPTVNTGSLVFVIVPQGGLNPSHVIHIGSTMHRANP